MNRTPSTARVLVAPVMVAVVALLGGCQALGIRFQSPIAVEQGEKRIGPGKMTASEIQSELMSFADTFNTTVSQQWNAVSSRGRAESAAGGLAAPSADVDHGTRLRRAAVENKLASVGASLSIASSPNPIVALSDMIVMITLQRMVLERPAARTLYGTDLDLQLVATYRDQEEAIWRLGRRAMTPEQQQELAALIDGWAAEHPTATNVANVRRQDFSSLRQQTILTGGQGGGSLLSLVSLDPLAGLDPTQRDLAKSRMLGERMFFYASRSPQIMKWHAESFMQNMTSTPEVRQTLTAVAKIGELAEELPEKVAAERSAAMDQMFQKLREERHATLEEISNTLTMQRDQMMQDLDEAQGALKELHEAAIATRETASAVTVAITAADAFVARVNPPRDPNAPPQPERDPLASYRAAMVETGAAAERLTILAQSLENLMASPALGGTSGTLQNAVQDARSASNRVIDRAFWRLVVLVVVAPFSVALAAGLYRVAVRRAGTRTG